MRRQPRPPVLSPGAAPEALPPAECALESPPGLVAVGGSLAPEWLRHAYRHGLFPWFSAGDPILWWSPARRMVFRPEALRVTRSLRQSVRNRGYLVGFDNEFQDVVAACANRQTENQAPESTKYSSIDNTESQAPDSTWIVPEMAAAYTALHREGEAHAVEVWKDGQLVGGLYGVSLGGMFWGESMFSRARDASKVALVALAGECRRRGIELIDAQFHTDHLASLGGFEMPRTEFLERVAALAGRPSAGPGSWQSPPAAAAEFLAELTPS